MGQSKRRKPKEPRSCQCTEAKKIFMNRFANRFPTNKPRFWRTSTIPLRTEKPFNSSHNALNFNLASNWIEEKVKLCWLRNQNSEWWKLPETLFKVTPIVFLGIAFIVSKQLLLAVKKAHRKSSLVLLVITRYALVTFGHSFLSRILVFCIILHVKFTLFYGL